MPPAITTTSASMSPRSVRTRPRLRSPVTRVFVKMSRAALAGALGERERELRGVEVAVRRKPGRAEHAVGRHQREELLRLLGRDQLERQPERLRPARLAAQLLHALLARREPDARRTRPSRTPRRASGRARPSTSSSSSGSPSRAAGRPGRPSGTSSRRSAGCGRPGPRRPSRARAGGRRSTCRRRPRRRSRSALRRGAPAATATSCGLPRSSRAKRGSLRAFSRRSKCFCAYSRKSKSSSETPAWTTPHMASRKSDMKRNSFSVGAAPRRPAARRSRPPAAAPPARRRARC